MDKFVKNKSVQEWVSGNYQSTLSRLSVGQLIYDEYDHIKLDITHLG